MSLFGSSPPAESSPARGRSQSHSHSQSLPQSQSQSLFAADSAAESPWSMPTPRKDQSRASLVRSLLPATSEPSGYADLYDLALRLDDDGGTGRVGPSAVAHLLAGSQLSASQQAQILALVLPERRTGEAAVLVPAEFAVLLALVGLAQEGDLVSLDTVDERRKNLPIPHLSGAFAAAASKPAPVASRSPSLASSKLDQGFDRLSDPEPGPEADPWRAPEIARQQSDGAWTTNGPAQLSHDPTSSLPALPAVSASIAKTHDRGRPSGRSRWSYFDGSGSHVGFDDESPPRSHSQEPGLGSSPERGRQPLLPRVAPFPSGVAGGTAAEEQQVIVTLMPEKEGVFLFQHHNYEVSSPRRDSKVIRRYSDFVWLLDCLHKRFPFRVLPLLPPKRVTVNGNHLSNDGAFMEKRRRGLCRFLNGLERHPVLCQEQLVVMFLTVPTELAVWRKQAASSIQDEFAGRELLPGLEDELPLALEDLFGLVRSGVKRSAELHITLCAVLDRLIKRSEGVAADHGRVALALLSMTEASADTYASDASEVPLLNDGLAAFSRRLRTCQTLCQDESRAWDAGVLEDLLCQRDALLNLHDLFDRRDRLDRDTIPLLERRIHASETKLAALRARLDTKPGEIEKVVDSILKDRQSIVQQHNRSVFVRECLRDELGYFQTTQYRISRWTQDWAQDRVKYAELYADNWRRLLDDLDGMPRGP